MSEIDPQVQYLIDAIVNAPNGKIELTYYREHAESITARLAQPTVTREDIRAAVDEADENFWTLWTDTPELSINMWLDAITDAVMAVIAPDTAGGSR